MEQIIQKKIDEWLTIDEEIRQELQELVDAGNEEELHDRFYTDLDFGTGGLRGIIGAGTNRMNRVVVARATQGFVAYLLKVHGDAAREKGAVIAYDSRIKSDEFALEAAKVFCGNGIKTALFDSLRPVPELSFAIRHLGCCCGVVITASHNPKEYNGYKAYWEDGGQLIPPHDKNVIEEVRKVKSLSDALTMEADTAKAEGLLRIIGTEVDEPYYAAVRSLSINPELCEKWGSAIKIVYTPLHGAGNIPVRESLKRFGFKNVLVVPEQEKPDGRFPTVESPNPEEPAALTRAIALAQKFDAELVIATDPDCDRMAIAAKETNGKYKLFNGNQIGSMLAYYILKSRKERGALPHNGVIIKTIVTTELQREIADLFNVETLDVLTGFKYIGEKIRQFEEEGTPENPSKVYLCGGEESYGYLIGTFSRDKDAVIACAMAAELCAYVREQGISLLTFMNEIYAECGLYKEVLRSLSFKGAEGLEKIRSIMAGLRADIPQDMLGSPLVEYRDYRSSKIYSADGTECGSIDLPESNVLALFFKDGTKITARPSGTEPKIKFYFSTRVDCTRKNMEEKKKEISKKIEAFAETFLRIVT